MVSASCGASRSFLGCFFLCFLRSSLGFLLWLRLRFLRCGFFTALAGAFLAAACALPEQVAGPPATPGRSVMTNSSSLSSSMISPGHRRVLLFFEMHELVVVAGFFFS